MLNLSLSPDQVLGEAVTIRFLPLSAVTNLGSVLWEKNAKRHDLQGVLESIEQYGFIDPPKWDSKLNDGNGGLIYGNGRMATIVGALIEAKRLGHEPPRGIPTTIDSGEWCIPVKFGVNSESEAMAMAAAIDHNNLTLSGSDLDIDQIAKIWNDDYVDLLKSIAEQGVMPVTVDDGDLTTLLSSLGGSRVESDGFGDESNGFKGNPNAHKTKMTNNVRFMFGEIIFDVLATEYTDFLARLRTEYGLEKTCLIKAIREKLEV